jgi:hypothetical protein
VTGDDLEPYDDEGVPEITGSDLLGPDGPRVLDQKCPTCIFRPGNPMKLRPGRVHGMVEDSLRGGGFITCHQTLPYGGHGDVRPAVCRGFFDAHGERSNLLRVWSRLGGFDFVPPPADHD